MAIIEQIIKIFGDAGVAFDKTENDLEDSIIWLDLAASINQAAPERFRLIIFALVDVFDSPYVRFLVSPLCSQPEATLVAQTTQAMARLNYDLVGTKLVWDTDNDIGLVMDVPISFLDAERLEWILERLIDDIEVVMPELTNLVSSDSTESYQAEDLRDLAEQFAAVWKDDLQLDFSVGSIERFEQQVDNEYREFMINEGILDRNILGFGAYIGDVLVRHAQGIWEIAEEVEKSQVRAAEQRYQPFVTARSFLSHSRSLRPSVLLRRAIR